MPSVSCNCGKQIPYAESACSPECYVKLVSPIVPAEVLPFNEPGLTVEKCWRWMTEDQKLLALGCFKDGSCKECGYRLETDKHKHMCHGT